MKASEHTAKVLRAAVGMAKAEPEHFDMESYAKRSSCGTVCCLAGNIALSSDEFSHFIFNEGGCWDLACRDGSDRSVCEFATYVAGLDLAGSAALFFDVQWPNKYAFDYRRARDRGDHPGMVAAAEARVEHFIKTGK